MGVPKLNKNHKHFPKDWILVPNKFENVEIVDYDFQQEKCVHCCYTKPNPNYEKEKTEFLKKYPDYEKEYGKLP